MNYNGLITADIANGLGVRVSLFVSGCTMGCPGCHNPEAQDFEYGVPFDGMAKAKVLRALSRPWVKGLTITGGHPLEEANVEEVRDFVFDVKRRFPAKDIWLYTGKTISYKDICDSELLKKCDVVVDGAYLEERKNPALAFRGSDNQKIIDVKQSLTNGFIIEVKGLE